MLGWHISAYRQAGGGGAAAEFESESGVRLAVWQTGLDGLDWLRDLVAAGSAISLGGNGYPIRYTAPFRELMPRIEAGPPKAIAYWVHGAADVIDRTKWPGQTTLDRQAIGRCSPDEWLIVEAWDES